MSRATMSWGECPEHGRQLHHGCRCVSCQPAKDPIFVRRAVEEPVKTYGNLGRPRSVDLTDREREIALMVATGKTQKQIAQELQITRAGVESTIGRAMDRIGAKRTYELVRYVRAEA